MSASLPWLHTRLERLRASLRTLPGFSPAGRSLQSHLMRWLLLPQLVLWAAAALVTYKLADRYANLAIDRSLYQSSRALARQVKPVGSGLFIDFPKAARDIIETDPDDKVYYMVSAPPGEFILGNHKLPPPPAGVVPQADRPYFYDATVDTIPVRVAALHLKYGEDDRPQDMLVQLAKSRASREELARNILIDTALPLSGLVLLMSLIVWAGIRTGLAPLSRLREAVKDRGPNDLAPIRIEQAPQEVRDLVKALNTLLQAVHESVAAHKRFISDAAHQLRTPLAGLKSQTEIALRDVQHGAPPADLAARLQRVHTSASRSAHLVNQLLTLARAEPEAAQAVPFTRVDLAHLARELAVEWVPRALQAGVDLGYDGEEDGQAWVLGHPLLLREALSNLIDNAVHYAGRGAEVTLRARRDGDQVVAEVEDNGPGIPEGERERVLERFVRGTSDGEGCGLGLAIVREILQRHRGEVVLKAARPRGLKVVLRLPVISVTDPRFGARPTGLTPN